MNANTGAALIQMAQVWLVFYAIYRILAPCGLSACKQRWRSR